MMERFEGNPGNGISAPAAGNQPAGMRSGVSLRMSGQSMVMTPDRIKKAQQTLAKYKEGKAALENRLIEEEQWYKLRHWEYLRRRQEKNAGAPEPTSA